MLKAAMCGNYVNFGVFKLYGDDSLDNVLNMAAKLIISIPQADLIVSVFCLLLFVELVLIIAFHLGISKTLQIIFPAARMPGHGSHCIPVNAGLGDSGVHSGESVRRTNGNG